jgi:hypothetical protein
MIGNGQHMRFESLPDVTLKSTASPFPPLSAADKPYPVS